MATVGGLSCDFVRGTGPAKKTRTQTWSVPGLNGYGAKVFGAGDSEGEFVLVKRGTYAAVATWVALIEAMQGTLVAVVNDWGQTTAAFLIEKVTVPELTAELGYGGARGELRISGVVT
jgi:hypothetical protein